MDIHAQIASRPLNKLKPAQNKSRQDYGKLDHETVLKIKADCLRKKILVAELKSLSLPALAKKYKTSTHIIDNIYQNRSYRHIQLKPKADQ